MPSKQLKLTENAIRKIKPPATGRDSYRDTEIVGLTLDVTRADSRAFYLVCRIHGNAVRLHICRFGDMRLGDVRKQALALKAQIARGDDPREAKRRAKDTMTLREAVEHFIAYKRDVKRAKGWKADERNFEMHCSSLANRRIDRITTVDIDRLLTTVGQKREAKTDNGKRRKKAGGPVVANRIRAILRAALNHAKVRPNPASDAIKYPEKKRQRFLRADELQRFFHALRSDPNAAMRDALLLMLFTGARRGNVLSMRWVDLDLAAGVWHIPDTKTGEPLTLPLAAPALAILRKRHGERNGSEWVLPGRNPAKPLHEIRMAWVRVCKAAELEDIRPHDLRHTLASWGANTGAGLPIIGRLLGHKHATTTARYAHLELAPAAAALETTAAAMLEAAGEVVEEEAEAVATRMLGNLTADQKQALLEALQSEDK